MSKRFSGNKALVGAVLGAAAGFGIALQMTGSGFGIGSAHAQNNESTYRNLELLGDIFERVRSAYVEPVDEEKLLQSAISGMLGSLDPHSSYLPPKGYEDMQEQTQGKFGGLGIEVTMEDGVVKVVAPIDDTPAARAGLQANDLITHLDGEPIVGLSLGEAVEKMRGVVDTKINLTVFREGKDEPFDVELTRAVITIFPVKARVEGDIGYLRITTFNKQTGEDLNTKIEELTQEIGDDLTGFVVDLRNNPGGLLSQAISVSDTFLDAGEIVSTRGRDARSAERYQATEGDLAGGKPIVVLINGGSASASEIVAGALQDHRRAIVVGTKSFGKGSVQTIMPLTNGGAMRLTTSRYYTPSGRSIQALGIEPDIPVEALKIEEQEAQSSRRSESSLRGSLENDNGDEEAAVTADELEARRKLRKEDYQLSYALDLLRGVSVIGALGKQ